MSLDTQLHVLSRFTNDDLLLIFLLQGQIWETLENDIDENFEDLGLKISSHSFRNGT